MAKHYISSVVFSIMVLTWMFGAYNQFLCRFGLAQEDYVDQRSYEKFSIGLLAVLIPALAVWQLDVAWAGYFHVAAILCVIGLLSLAARWKLLGPRFMPFLLSVLGYSWLVGLQWSYNAIVDVFWLQAAFMLAFLFVKARARRNPVTKSTGVDSGGDRMRRLVYGVMLVAVLGVQISIVGIGTQLRVLDFHAEKAAALRAEGMASPAVIREKRTFWGAMSGGIALEVPLYNRIAYEVIKDPGPDVVIGEFVSAEDFESLRVGDRVTALVADDRYALADLAGYGGDNSLRNSVGSAVAFAGLIALAVGWLRKRRRKPVP